MKYIKKYEYFYSGKNIHEEQQKKNENILKLIYDEGLQYHEGEFKPKTWFRNGDLLSDQIENDKLITNFAGMSLVYDLITKEYTLVLPPKFNISFCIEIKDIMSKKFNITDCLLADYNRRFYSTIKFNEHENSEEL